MAEKVCKFCGSKDIKKVSVKKKFPKVGIFIPLFFCLLGASKLYLYHRSQVVVDIHKANPSVFSPESTAEIANIISRFSYLGYGLIIFSALFFALCLKKYKGMSDSKWSCSFCEDP